MNLFYIPELVIPIDMEQWVIDLPSDEANHAIKVLRLSIGDSVNLTNGTGLMVNAEIIAMNKKQCVVKVNNYEEGYGRRSFKIHIAVAPTKNIKRFGWFLEKATEMGIDEITPLISSHSERKEIKVERERKVITAAVKQSLKAYHPKLNEPVTFKQFLQMDLGDELFIAHLLGPDQLLLKEAYNPNKSCCILIGPEGDFSATEIENAKNKGFLPVSLGNTRLRTETAALAACFTINMMNQ